jgi:uncharacterized membrane protein HdeD (DUF308 family)
LAYRPNRTIGGDAWTVHYLAPRNWWFIGVRGAIALMFATTLVALPRPTIASLMVCFAVYLTADGAFALLAAARAARRGEYSDMQLVEGMINLTVAGVVLILPAVAVAPLLRLAGGWAVISGALMLAAAHRLAGTRGRLPLALVGAASSLWGGFLAGFGPTQAEASGAASSWLVVYGVVYGALLVYLAVHLHRSPHGVAPTEP